LAKHKFAINDKEYDVEVGARQGRNVQVTVNGKAYEVELKPSAVVAPVAPRSRSIAPAAAPAAAAPAASSAGGGDGDVTAPMAGLVLNVLVRVGDTVNAGDDLLMLEAMKMENAITAHRSGKVTALNVAEGAAIGSGDTIALIE
jgi:biotin carboxyl carrier protein